MYKKDFLLDVIYKLVLNIRNNNIESFDPYDALNSDIIINSRLLKKNLLSRLLIKSINTLPINLRPLLKIRTTQNDSKVLADILLTKSLLKQMPIEILQTDNLIQLLVENSMKTENGIGFGLKFPYSSRYTKSFFTPNLFTTVNVASSLLKGYSLHNSEKIREIILKINSFIVNDLGVINNDDGTAYIRYYLGLNEMVFNVNALALKYFVDYQRITNDTSYENKIVQILNMLLVNQNVDGSWFYSKSSKGAWVDGFHTGYIIESLISFYQYSNDPKIYKSIEKASVFFKNKLLNNNFPMYKSSNKYPIDSQNCAQAIQTRVFLSQIGLDDIESVYKMFLEIHKVLFTEKGYYGYKRNRLFFYKNNYLRWSTSPFLLALTYLYNSLND